MFDFDKMGDAFAAMDRTAKTIDAMLVEQRVTNYLLAILISLTEGTDIGQVGLRVATLLAQSKDIANGPDART